MTKPIHVIYDVKKITLNKVANELQANVELSFNINDFKEVDRFLKEVDGFTKVLAGQKTLIETIKDDDW